MENQSSPIAGNSAIIDYFVSPFSCIRIRIAMHSIVKVVNEALNYWAFYPITMIGLL